MNTGRLTAWPFAVRLVKDREFSVRRASVWPRLCWRGFVWSADSQRFPCLICWRLISGHEAQLPARGPSRERGPAAQAKRAAQHVGWAARRRRTGHASHIWVPRMSSQKMKTMMIGSEDTPILLPWVVPRLLIADPAVRSIEYHPPKARKDSEAEDLVDESTSMARECSRRELLSSIVEGWKLNAAY